MLRASYCFLAIAAILPTAGYCGQFITIDCPDATSTQAVSLNDHSWVVGTCLVGSFNRSFIRMPDETIHVFAVEATQTFANDINDSGVVVGYYAKEKTYLTGFFTVQAWPQRSIIPVPRLPSRWALMPLARSPDYSKTA
jgi:hypothetical protein